MKKNHPLPYLPKTIYQLFEKSLDVIYVRHGHDYSFAYMNAAFDKLWGMSREKLYQDSNSWFDHIHPDDRTAYAAQSKQFFEKMQPNSAEFFYRINVQPYIERRIKEIVLPVYDGESSVAFLGLIHDVTYSKTQKAEFE